MPANLENSAVATGLEKIKFHSNPKIRQCQRTLKLLHNCTHLTRQQSSAQNSPTCTSTVLEPWISRSSSWIYKRQRNKRSNCQHPLGHLKGKRVPKKEIYFCFIDYAKAFDYVDHNKLLKILQEMGHQITLPPSWETCMQVKKQQLELTWNNRLVPNWEGVCQGCILSPCLFNLYAE